MNFLLSMVSDDGAPDFEITAMDGVRAIFEEYGTELWLMFALGVIVGIILTNIYAYIRYTLFAEKNDKKYTIVVFKEDGKSGAEDCGPVFKEIAERITNNH